MSEVNLWAVVVSDDGHRPTYIVDDSFMTQEAAELWAERFGLAADAVPVKTAREATQDLFAGAASPTGDPAEPAPSPGTPGGN